MFFSYIIFSLNDTILGKRQTFTRTLPLKYERTLLQSFNNNTNVRKDTFKEIIPDVNTGNKKCENIGKGTK